MDFLHGLLGGGRSPKTITRTLWHWRCECDAHSRGGDTWKDRAESNAQRHQWSKGVGHPMPEVYATEVEVPRHWRDPPPILAGWDHVDAERHFDLGHGSTSSTVARATTRNPSKPLSMSHPRDAGAEPRQHCRSGPRRYCRGKHAPTCVRRAHHPALLRNGVLVRQRPPPYPWTEPQRCDLVDTGPPNNRVQRFRHRQRS
jgi:hypothetical protein